MLRSKSNEWEKDFRHLACYWNHRTAQERGEAIFTSPSLDARLMSIARDEESRLLPVTLSIQEVEYMFTSVYCPNHK